MRGMHRGDVRYWHRVPQLSRGHIQHGLRCILIRGVHTVRRRELLGRGGRLIAGNLHAMLRWKLLYGHGRGDAGDLRAVRFGGFFGHGRGRMQHVQRRHGGSNLLNFLWCRRQRYRTRRDVFVVMIVKIFVAFSYF